MPDKIDEAMAAVDEAAEAHAQVTVTIASTGRHVAISFPVDMTDAEALEFVGWVGTQLRLTLAQRRAGPPSRLIVPAHVAQGH